MKKTTLVAPFDDPLALAVAGEARIFGHSIAALLPGAEKNATRKEGAEKPDASALEAPRERAIPWNTASYISARAAVLEATVRFGTVDEAVLVASPGSAPGLDAKPAEIEKAFHDRVLGYFWLVRELLSRFSERESEFGPGRLIFVIADRGQPPRSPVEAAAFGALASFAESLTETAPDSPYDIWTIHDSCPQDDPAAQYIAKILETSPDRKAARVVKFTGKTGIFNRI